MPDVDLLRPGAPLIDVMERFTRWDDRGTAFVTWRIVPGVDERAMARLSARAKEAGLAGGGNLRAFEDALETFQSVNFDDAVNVSRTLVKQEDPLAALAHYCRARRPAVVSARDLKRTATAFLGDVAPILIASRAKRTQTMVFSTSIWPRSTRR